MNKRFKITLAKKSGFSNTNAVNKSKQRNMTKLIYPAPSTISVSYIKKQGFGNRCFERVPSLEYPLFNFMYK